MKKELDEKLVQAFPILYRQRNLPMSQTAMCWGFPGDGWFDLIYNLSEKLEAINNKLPEGSTKIEASQVKSKFGTLRFYVDGINKSVADEVYKLINEAENLSGKTCEYCGKPGKETNGGWVRTQCEDCSKTTN